MKIVRMNEDTVLMEGTVSEGMFTKRELETMILIEFNNNIKPTGRFTQHSLQLSRAINILDGKEDNNE